ncbi:TetR/AcrR family transcriptional regulator [Natrarchaeobius halalkaliphilus]|uniref:TetR/AcrR family transcriptional regulator n=1 Tax=Natrarchaeobius halalkaliphilus TaxID=1679091 RepID=A0A3N6MU20_9EURY|nr:TetR/AcrR family transcriptional regulator [Natrarchaeobius halalkaliphilus]RQG88882.1 TetR/AcrR family transcriptional regulator [Natrarchaeobius halalkaliphilus]
MATDLFDEPDGTREEILAATYRALRTHGYADLTISAIGEEFEKSPSLVYRHYESKDDLVLACLAFMLERFEARMTDDEITDSRRRLEAFLHWGLDEMSSTRYRFVTTLVELRLQATHDEAYQEHFTRSDDVFESHVVEIVQSGVDRGDFQECDPERVAAMLVTIVSGALFRRATSDSAAWPADVQAELEAYLESTVYRD